MIPNFWQLAIKPILKVHNFPLGVLIFRQKSFKFGIPAWKLNNPYYHNTQEEVQHLVGHQFDSF